MRVTRQPDDDDCNPRQSAAINGVHLAAMSPDDDDCEAARPEGRRALEQPIVAHAQRRLQPEEAGTRGGGGGGVGGGGGRGRGVRKGGGGGGGGERRSGGIGGEANGAVDRVHEHLEIGGRSRGDREETTGSW